jgi:hypothetical protein
MSPTSLHPNNFRQGQQSISSGIKGQQTAWTTIVVSAIKIENLFLVRKTGPEKEA